MQMLFLVQSITHIPHVDDYATQNSHKWALPCEQLQLCMRPMTHPIQHWLRVWLKN